MTQKPFIIGKRKILEISGVLYLSLPKPLIYNYNLNKGAEVEYLIKDDEIVLRIKNEA